MGIFCGIDIGGTSIKICIVEQSGRMLAKGGIPTPVLNRAGCRALCALVEELEHEARLALAREIPARGERPAHTRRETPERPRRLEGIGIGVPGAVDEDGSISLMPNAHMDVAELADALRRAYGDIPLAWGNDANAAALGEQWMGAAAGFDSMVLITLGTGVGAGVVANGSILAGAHGGGGEIGHLCVAPGGRPCNCGGIGCLEQYASAPALVRNANDAAGNARFRNIADVFHAFEEGDAHAAQAVETLQEKLAFALAQTSCILDPDIMLVGGGLGSFFQNFAAGLKAAYRRRAIAPCRTTPIAPASLGNAAGMIGAARMAMLESRNHRLGER